MLDVDAQSAIILSTGEKKKHEYAKTKTQGLNLSLFNRSDEILFCHVEINQCDEKTIDKGISLSLSTLCLCSYKSTGPGIPPSFCSH